MDVKVICYVYVYCGIVLLYGLFVCLFVVVGESGAEDLYPVPENFH